jgi:ABC-type hemin transport system substrate-binding protein
LLGVSAPEFRVGNPATAKEFVDRVRQLFRLLGLDEHAAALPQRLGQPLHSSADDRHPQT